MPEAGPCQSHKHWVNGILGKVGNQELYGAKGGAFGLHHDQQWQLDERNNRHKSLELDDVALAALGFSHDVIEAFQLENGKVCGVA